MNKNRFLVAGLATILSISNVLPVLAADNMQVFENKSDTADILVNCEIKSGYTVTLPAAVTLEKTDSFDGYNYAKEFKVGVQGNIDSDKMVTVQAKADTFELKDVSGSRTISFDVTQSGKEWFASELGDGSTKIEKDAGAFADIKLAGNYSGNAEYEFFLGKGERDDLPVTINAFNDEYDGNPHSLNIVSEGSEILYSIDGKNYTSEVPVFTDAGTYTVFYKVTQKGFKPVTGSKDIVINKAANNYIIEPTVSENSIIGKPVSLTNVPQAKFGTIEYKIGANGTYSTEIPIATKSGDIDLYYRVSETDNYYGIEENHISLHATSRPAGLYDAEGNMTKTWDELVALGINSYRRSNDVMYSNPLGDVLVGDLVIADGVTTINENTFRSCTNLTSVYIPDTVTSIGDYAFSRCTSLKSVYIPDSVEYINFYAFCNTGLTEVSVPDSVVMLKQGAFSDCKDLVSAKLSNSMNTIYDDTFKNCTSLKEVIIPDSVKYINKAFIGSGLTEFVVPDSVTRIGNAAFQKCLELTSIYIPDSVTEMGTDVFSGCTKLSNVTLPNSITQIPTSTFRNCTSLTTITIPESITKIGNGAFCYCTNLIVEIPDSVKSIDSTAFIDVPHVYYNGTASYKPWGAKAVN